MLDMERYAGPVLSSYAVSLLLLGLLIGVTLRRGRRARRALEAVERKGDRDA